VLGAVRAAQDKKGLDVVVLDLRKAGGFTDFFVICTGTNPRQITAIADSVEDTLRTEFGERPHLTEGVEKITVDPARLLQLRRAHLQPRVPQLLRARTPLGKRRAAQLLRGSLDATDCRDARARLCGVRRPSRLAAPRLRLSGLLGRHRGRVAPPMVQCSCHGRHLGGRYEGALRDVIHAFKYEDVDRSRRRWRR